MNDIDLAREAARRIVAKVSPQAVYWFGSRAEGCGAPDSDFDLFVVLDDHADASASQGLLRRELTGLPAAFDIVTANLGPWLRWAAVPATLEHRVAAHGVQLYAAHR